MIYYLYKARDTTKGETTMASKTISWTSTRGAVIEATLHYESQYSPSRPIDDGWEGHTKADIYVKKSISVSVNREHKGIAGYFYAPDPKHVAYKPYIDAGCTIMANVKLGDKIITIAADGITLDEINSAWDALAEEADDDDVKALKQLRADVERKNDIARATRIMDLVDSTIARCGKLPNQKQANAWRREYNDFHNEGGDGYIPEIVTLDQVEWARQIIG